jgi:GNAT superfamily N-acetyltransferase
MTPPTDAYPLADLALSRKLERAEADSAARFTDAHARVAPDCTACHTEIAGATVLFDGPTSPVTQTFGLGLFQPLTASELDAIEAFYRERHSPVFHEVSPLADPSAVTLLNDRGYRPCEFTSILFRPIGRGVGLGRPLNPEIRTRVIADADRDRWVETSVRGWSETPGLDDFFRDLGKITAAWDGVYSFVAELDGRFVATASLSLGPGVAVLAGASTIPEARGRGAQLALLDARLRFAADRGCDLALMGALPGSGSQRNAERHGFRIAYTRIKWRLPDG